MKWLVWKDYRLNRPIFVVVLLALLAAQILGAWLAWAAPDPHQAPRLGLRLAENALIAALQSTLWLQLTLAILGGNSLAGERRDRSAEFLASLPISRGQIVASKLLVTLGLLALIWLPNAMIAAIAWLGFPPLELSENEWHTVATIPLSIAITGLTGFSFAWFFSSILESSTFAAAAGLLIPLLLWSGIVLMSLLLDSYRHYWLPACLGVCAVLAVASFAAGTAYYLRRVEP